MPSLPPFHPIRNRRYQREDGDLGENVSLFGMANSRL
jgi:hypothetical protein